MQHIHVKSESVKSAAYDAESSVLEVRFQNGGLYQYQGVPHEKFNYLLTADSIGKYLNEQIKPNYPARKIEEPARAEETAAGDDGRNGCPQFDEEEASSSGDEA